LTTGIPGPKFQAAQGHQFCHEKVVLKIKQARKKRREKHHSIGI